jgi:hypothetical protein
LKTLRVSDSLHDKLTRLLGEMMAKTGKPQTYTDVVDRLTAQSIIMPTKLLEKIDAVINTKQFSCKSREQFIEDAVTAMIQNLYENVSKKSLSGKT